MVVSFEPNPETFTTLQQNVDMNGLANVRLINVALGEKQSTLPLVYCEHEGGLGTLDKARQAKLLSKKHRMRTRTVLVEVYPLDEYILAEQLPDPDFVKIDVEGYEHNVLFGMQNTMRHCKPGLLVEIHGPGKEGRRENLRKIVELLILHGYEIQEIASGQRIVESRIELAARGSMLACR